MDKQWYVVNTYSGHENKVKEKLEMRSESMDMQDYIFRVIQRFVYGKNKIIYATATKTRPRVCYKRRTNSLSL